MVFAVARHPGIDCSPAVDWVEYFSGDQAVTNAMTKALLQTATFEKNADEIAQNMLTSSGFVNAVLLALRLRAGGGANTAPVCSTWVWLSRHSTKRRLWNPLGSRDFPCVQDVPDCRANAKKTNKYTNKK